MFKKFPHLFFIFSIFFFGACGSDLIEGLSDTSEDDTITFSSLSSGASTVTLPLAVFGDAESDVTGSTIAIFVDGTSIDEIDADDFYDDTDEEVSFNVTSLSTGDLLAIVVDRSSGTDKVFVHSVSSTSIATVEDTDTVSDDNEGMQLVESICSRMNACVNDFDQTLCLVSILFTEQLHDEFGVSSTLAMQEIVEELDEGNLTASSSHFDDCVTDIAAVSCTDIEDAYDSGTPDDFENLEDFIPTGSSSCEGIF